MAGDDRGDLREDAGPEGDARQAPQAEGGHRFGHQRPSVGTETPS